MTDAILTSRRSLSGEPVLASRKALSDEAAGSAVSWAAILAGAFAATAFTIALVALGAGIGLVSVSPWSHDNVSVTTFGMLAAAWFLAVQLFSSGLGGYLAGRLRTRWVGVHTDEVYFRDTAHGLMVWAVGAVVSALLLTSAASSVASGVARAGAAAVQAVGAAAAGPAAQVAGQAVSGDPAAYFTDMLFRTDHPAASGDTAASTAEIGRIFARALASGDLPATDKTYAAQVVASRTGLSQADAEKRVTDVFDQAKSAAEQAADKAKAAADTARKTGIYVSLWAFASLLVGAFAASYMATVGGRSRDEALMSD
jgi:hypothetical protein